jgi:hypothetical protein
VIGSVKNVQTVDHRFKIVEKMFFDLLPSLMISFLVMIFGFRKKLINKEPIRKNESWSFALLFIGLSGVLPIMISLKQSSFYIIAAFPFFSLALAMYVLPVVEKLFERIRIAMNSYLKVISIILLTFSLILSLLLSGRIGRDQAEMGDLYLTLELIPENSMISMAHEMSEEWEVYAMYSRYGGITVTPDPTQLQQFYLTRKNNQNIPENYTKLSLPTTLYDLYKRDRNP